MLKKNILIAFRSLKKDLPFSISNLAGLTIGITCCLLIFAFVRYELSFDQFHTKKDRIYRVNYDVLMGGNHIISPSVPVFVAPALKSKFPEIADVTRFVPEYGSCTFRHGDVIFDEKQFCYADPNFFNIFDFKPVTGNVHTVLNKPNTLVITKSTAKKYFGKEEPVGRVLLFNNKQEYIVAAVIEDLPSNSHFSFDFLTSLYNIPDFKSKEVKEVWNNPNYSTYLLLKPGTRPEGLSQKIEAWVNPPGEAGQSASQNTLHLALEPLKNVHFNTGVFNYKNLLNITDIKYIYIFITIALLILLIACANYVNLSTAKASMRAKEVGVRKTIGAGLGQLFTQFITESFLLTFFAVLISITAVFALLPYLNNLLGRDIPFNLSDTTFLMAVIGGTVVISLLAGFYPALVLAGYKPIETLKGTFTQTGRYGGTIRKGLVVLQFTISVGLILGTIIVSSQLRFMQTEKLGLDKDQVLIIKGNADIYNKLGAFADELRKINGVAEVSQTWRSPFETVIGNGFSIKSDPVDNDDWHVVGGIAGDQHYIPTLGISLLAGRNFDASKIKGDSTVNEFIVNEAFLQHYQLKPGEVIGKNVILGLAGPGPIVGVMKDFHISSMHDKIGPVVLFNKPAYFGSLLLRAGPGNMPALLAAVEKKWKAYAPSRPFNYSFLDEEYDALYRTEQKLGALMSLFSGLAIFITCIGLLGLMTFMLARRTKEIGIRKVLGASVFNIATLLSKDFLRLVFIAIVIALPSAWYFMNNWLQDFAYRVHIGWWIFFISGGIAVLIALLTVSVQSIKAASTNPVKSLRTD